MLTRKQYQLLMFIHEKLLENGVSPSFEEMKEALDLKSKSGIHRLITGLEERGFLRRLAHRARALEVIKLPDNSAPEDLPARNRRVETIKEVEPIGSKEEEEGAIGSAVTVNPFAAASTIQLQLYGKIAAGTPIEALRDNTSFVDVPIAMLGKGDHYALEVDGDSMVEAGILNGDTVVIKQTNRADNGDIVVALVDNEEATLKTIRQEKGEILLEPANRDYQIKRYRAEQVRIQGRLIGLLRQY